MTSGPPRTKSNGIARVKRVGSSGRILRVPAESGPGRSRSNGTVLKISELMIVLDELSVLIVQKVSRSKGPLVPLASKLSPGSAEMMPVSGALGNASSPPIRNRAAPVKKSPDETPSGLSRDSGSWKSSTAMLVMLL